MFFVIAKRLLKCTMVGREKKERGFRGTFQNIEKYIEGNKRKKCNYYHPVYSQILAKTFDFMKIVKQTPKSRKRVLNIQIKSLSQ